MRKLNKGFLSINRIQKKIRAEVIKEYLDSKGVDRCVCFTSGNSATCLKKVGLNVVEVGRFGLLDANRWLSFIEVAGCFNLFDATSGHLPFPLMVEIADRIKKKIGKLKGEYYIYTGSGETIVCLKLAYPNIEFVPLYNVPGLAEETMFVKQAPLNSLVSMLCGKIEPNKSTVVDNNIQK